METIFFSALVNLIACQVYLLSEIINHHGGEIYEGALRARLFITQVYGLACNRAGTCPRLGIFAKSHDKIPITIDLEGRLNIFVKPRYHSMTDLRVRRHLSPHCVNLRHVNSTEIIRNPITRMVFLGISINQVIIQYIW
jgi:hypothetical protein